MKIICKFWKHLSLINSTLQLWHNVVNLADLSPCMLYEVFALHISCKLIELFDAYKYQNCYKHPIIYIK